MVKLNKNIDNFIYKIHVYACSACWLPKVPIIMVLLAVDQEEILCKFLYYKIVYFCDIV